MRTIFRSQISHQDAAQQAQRAGYRVVGVGTNPKGYYVVFAEKQDPNKFSNFARNSLSGKL